MIPGIIQELPKRMGMTFHFLWYIHSAVSPIIFIRTVPDISQTTAKFFGLLFGKTSVTLVTKTANDRIQEAKFA